MIRVTLALLLLFSTVFLRAASHVGLQTTLSLELAMRNPLAIVIFLSLGCLLWIFFRHCRAVGWKILAATAAGLIPLLALIAATPPRNPVHLTAFLVFLGIGVTWMVCYAEADLQRPIAVLSLLFVCSSLALGFVLLIVSILTSVDELSLLGLIQQGFLILFALMSLRRPNLTPEIIEAAAREVPEAASVDEAETIDQDFEHEH